LRRASQPLPELPPRPGRRRQPTLSASQR